MEPMGRYRCRCINSAFGVILVAELSHPCFSCEPQLANDWSASEGVTMNALQPRLKKMPITALGHLIFSLIGLRILCTNIFQKL